jgi:hypothetical protein
MFRDMTSVCVEFDSLGPNDCTFPVSRYHSDSKSQQSATAAAALPEIPVIHAV